MLRSVLRRFGFLIICSTILISLFSCSNQNLFGMYEYYEPVKVLPPSDIEADYGQMEMGFEGRNLGVEALLGNTIFEGRVMGIEGIDIVFREVLEFLFREFGSSPLPDYKVTIRLGDKANAHAVVIINDGGDRIVSLASINFVEGQRHYVAHELFHAFYQPRFALSLPLHELEAWATYAEIRYLLRDRTNMEIYNYLLDAFRISKKDGEEARGSKHPWYSHPPSVAMRYYVANVLPFFQRTPLENYSLYRQWLERVSEMERLQGQ